MRWAVECKGSTFLQPTKTQYSQLAVAIKDILGRFSHSLCEDYVATN